jgi:hypothetical protein
MHSNDTFPSTPLVRAGEVNRVRNLLHLLTAGFGTSFT